MDSRRPPSPCLRPWWSPPPCSPSRDDHHYHRIVTPEPTSSTTTTTEPIQITVAAVGDVLTHMPIVNSVRDPKTGSYDFRSDLRTRSPPICRRPTTPSPTSRPALPVAEPGYSGYPRFNSPGELAYALEDVGVDLVATANNHSLDMGWDGIVSTLDKLDAAAWPTWVPTGRRRRGPTPFIVDIRGIKVAFLNYTASLNGLVPPEDHPLRGRTPRRRPGGQDAVTARMWGADVVIAHPPLRQRVRARAERGADGDLAEAAVRGAWTSSSARIPTWSSPSRTSSSTAAGR